MLHPLDPTQSWRYSARHSLFLIMIQCWTNSNSLAISDQLFFVELVIVSLLNKSASFDRFSVTMPEKLTDARTPFGCLKIGLLEWPLLQHLSAHSNHLCWMRRWLYSVVDQHPDLVLKISKSHLNVSRLMTLRSLLCLRLVIDGIKNQISLSPRPNNHQTCRLCATLHRFMGLKIRSSPSLQIHPTLFSTLRFQSLGQAAYLRW